MKLYKTTIVIWSEYDPSSIEMATLVHEAEFGAAYCSKSVSECVNNAEQDTEWDGTEFFNDPFETEDEVE